MLGVTAKELFHSNTIVLTGFLASALFVRFNNKHQSKECVSNMFYCDQSWNVINRMNPSTYSIEV